jgi:hypothetical protein
MWSSSSLPAPSALQLCSPDAGLHVAGDVIELPDVEGTEDLSRTKGDSWGASVQTCSLQTAVQAVEDSAGSIIALNESGRRWEICCGTVTILQQMS